jgi:hypothetical protein
MLVSRLLLALDVPILLLLFELFSEKLDTLKILLMLFRDADKFEAVFNELKILD